jgi:hypothetical protein
LGGLAVIVTRPGIWGNPFRAGRDGTLREVMVKYEAHVRGSAELMSQLPELRGEELICQCGSGRRKKGDKNCHRFVLYKLVDEL